MKMTEYRPRIVAENCKGCGLCERACPHGCLVRSPRTNAYGVHYLEYVGSGCVGCGLCFRTCPEPWALGVEEVR